MQVLTLEYSADCKMCAEREVTGIHWVSVPWRNSPTGPLPAPQTRPLPRPHFTCVPAPVTPASLDVPALPTEQHALGPVRGHSGARRPSARLDPETPSPKDRGCISFLLCLCSEHLLKSKRFSRNLARKESKTEGPARPSDLSLRLFTITCLEAS